MFIGKSKNSILAGLIILGFAASGCGESVSIEKPVDVLPPVEVKIDEPVVNTTQDNDTDPVAKDVFRLDLNKQLKSGTLSAEFNLSVRDPNNKIDNSLDYFDKVGLRFELDFENLTPVKDTNKWKKL